MAKNIVGLTMSDQRLLATELGGSSARPKLLRVGALHLPPGVLTTNDVSNSAALTQAISELWETAGFQSKRVRLGIGNQRVLVRNHVVPHISAAHLGKALRFQVRDFLPVPVDETILDFYPIAPVPESDPPQMSGLLVAAIKEKVEVRVEAIANAGLKPVGVDLIPFALLRTIPPGVIDTGNHVVVAIGDRVTNIVIVRDAVPQFVRIVPIGNSHVTDALMRVADGNASREQVKNAKFNIGLTGGSRTEAGVTAELIREATDPIFNQLRSTRAYYSNNFPEVEINSAILLGSATRVPGFQEELSECCGVQGAFADPLATVNTSGAQPEALVGAIRNDLAEPIGLALGGL